MGNYLSFKQPVKEGLKEGIKEGFKESEKFIKPSAEDIGKKHQTGLGLIGLGIGLGFTFFSLSILGSTSMIGKSTANSGLLFKQSLVIHILQCDQKVLSCYCSIVYLLIFGHGALCTFANLCSYFVRTLLSRRLSNQPTIYSVFILQCESQQH